MMKTTTKSAVKKPGIQFPVHARVIVEIRDGCVSRIVSNDRQIDVEILDMDTQDQEQDIANQDRSAELDSALAAGKLHCIYGDTFPAMD